MCNAELSLTTFEWQNLDEPVLDVHRPKHSCVNWDTMTSSILHRVVRDSELTRLQKPTAKRGVDYDVAIYHYLGLL